MCAAFCRRQRSLTHCWHSAENIQWHRHLPCLCCSPSLPHTWKPAHSHIPLCWNVHQRRSVFTRSRLSLHYLELLMQWAMWTWNWKQMLNSIVESCRPPLLQNPLPMCAIWSRNQKSRVIFFMTHSGSGLTVSSFTETKGFWSPFFSVSTKCSDSSFVVLLVLTLILELKFG